MKGSTQLVKILPMKDGLDIVIWNCPTCRYRFWERAAGLDHDVHCPLCGRPVWPGANEIQIDFQTGGFR